MRLSDTERDSKGAAPSVHTTTRFDIFGEFVKSRMLERGLVKRGLVILTESLVVFSNAAHQDSRETKKVSVFILEFKRMSDATYQ